MAALASGVPCLTVSGGSTLLNYLTDESGPARLPYRHAAGSAGPTYAPAGTSRPPYLLFAANGRFAATTVLRRLADRAVAMAWEARAARVCCDTQGRAR